MPSLCHIYHAMCVCFTYSFLTEAAHAYVGGEHGAGQ